MSRHYVVGQSITPVPLWNKTERPPNRLPEQCTVLAVKYGQTCESGTMLRVLNNSGVAIWLDSHWFIQ